MNWREAEDPQMVLPGSVDPEMTQVLTSGARLCRRSLGRHVTGLGLVQCGCVVGLGLVGLASGWLMARLEFQRWGYGWFRACLRRRPKSQKSRNRPNTSGKKKSKLMKKPEKTMILQIFRNLTRKRAHPRRIVLPRRQATILDFFCKSTQEVRCSAIRCATSRSKQGILGPASVSGHRVR